MSDTSFPHSSKNVFMYNDPTPVLYSFPIVKVKKSPLHNMIMAVSNGSPNDLEKIFGMAANSDLDDTYRGNCKKRHPTGVLP